MASKKPKKPVFPAIPVTTAPTTHILCKYGHFLLFLWNYKLGL